MPDLVLVDQYGNPMTRDGGLVVIPDGSLAEDCDCCNPPPCLVCDEFTSATMDVTISGFPNPYITTRQWNPIFNTVYIITITGLDAVNKTYNLVTDPLSCDFRWHGEYIDVTVTLEEYWLTTSYYDPDPCIKGALRTTSTKSVRFFVSVRPTSYYISGYIFSGSAYIVDFSNGGIGVTECAGGTADVYHDAGFCPEVTNFTHTGLWVFTGVP